MARAQFDRNDVIDKSIELFWLDASFGGHSTAEAASVVRNFLQARPNYPYRLRGKIQQSADMLFRAAEISQDDRGGK